MNRFTEAPRDNFKFGGNLNYFILCLTIVIRTERQSGNTGRTTHFTQLCCIFMGGHYLKAYRTTKKASGKDDFLYEDDLDAVLAIIDADMFENVADMESEIVTCIKNLPSRENCSFKCEFYPKVCLTKVGLSRHKKAKHQQHSTHDSVAIVILAVRDQEWNLLISV